MRTQAKRRVTVFDDGGKLPPARASSYQGQDTGTVSPSAWFAQRNTSQEHCIPPPETSASTSLATPDTCLPW